MSDFHVPEIIHKHPAASVGIILLGGAALFILLSAGGGGSANAGTYAASNPGGLSDQAYAAYLQSQTAVQQQAGALSAQQNQQAFQLTALQTQQASQLALLKEQDATTITTTNTAADLAKTQATNQAAIQSQALSAQLQGLMNNNITSEHLATITANEQLGIAQTTADTQKRLADVAYWNTVQITNANTQQVIQQTNAATQQLGINADIAKLFIQTQGAVAVTQSNNNAAVGIQAAQSGAQAAKYTQNSNSGGGGGILDSLFGFLF